MSVALSEISPKRAAILDAASALFLAQGYAAVSIDSVAKGAGVSKATLYAHFTSKEALFGAIVSARCEAIAAEAEAMLHSDLPAEQALREAGRIWLRFLLAPQTIAIFRTVVAEAPRFPDMGRAFQAAGPAAGRAWLVRLLEEEERAGLLRPGIDRDCAATQLSALLRGDLHIRAMLGAPPPSEAELGAWVDQAVEVFLRAYGVEGLRASGTEAVNRKAHG